jgi:hypothetical protein
MTKDLINILEAFYNKLLNNIIREEKYLRNESVLWTLMEINAKKTEKYLTISSYNIDKFPNEKLYELQNLGFTSSTLSNTNKIEFILTSKGIWEIEKLIKDFSENDLLNFIQAKYLTFKAKQKPLDDKDKVALLSLLCLRNFSTDVPMNLNSSKNLEGWAIIFKKTFEFLEGINFLNSKYVGFENFISVPGSENPIQSLMRHRNDLPIKSGQIFCNPGQSKYYLDLIEEGELQKDRLIYTFRLVFPVIPDYNSVIMIENLCVETANDMSKYVLQDYRFIDSTYDDIIKRALEDIYIG